MHRALLIKQGAQFVRQIESARFEHIVLFDCHFPASSLMNILAIGYLLLSQTPPVYSPLPNLRSA